MRFHTYDDAVAFLLGRINYERNPTLADRQTFKLDRMRRLLELLGSPQDTIPAVHITGTKGKGSTAVMTAAALTAAGIRTGLYTSPHLERFEERMRVDGEMPTSAEFVEIAGRVADAVLRLDKEEDELAATYFETATALAWEFFVRRGAELVVLEVGLGGRLDATNVCRPSVVAITNVSRDHTALLGDTPAEIAFEKAGIIKPGVLCISGVEDVHAANVIRRVCSERQSPLLEIEGRFEVLEAGNDRTLRQVRIDGSSWGALTVPLAGRHQAKNAAVSLHLLKALAEGGLSVTEDAIVTGWKNLKWPARVEVAGRNPTVVIDAAHNVASAEALVKALEEDFPPARRILLFAGSREKDLAGMLRQLAPAFDAVLLTAFRNNPRAMPPERLLAMWQAVTDRPAQVVERSEEAFAVCREMAGDQDLICVTGSFFLAAEIRPLLVP